MVAEADHARRRAATAGYSIGGVAQRYDRARPQPPAALKAMLSSLLSPERIRTVVDLGSGTGLSARFWADVADEVIGIEPNPTMRATAQAMTPQANVRYVDGFGEETGLPGGVADVVTAAQSMQWMEPDATFLEIGRLLRPRGLFCAYEYTGLQTPGWEPEAAWARLRETVRRLRTERGLDADERRWPISLESMEASGCFQFVREKVLHSAELGDGLRLLDFALSEGSLQTLLASGVTESEVGLDLLRSSVATMRTPVLWWIDYRVWLGLRA